MSFLFNALKNVIVLLFILTNLGKLHACDCTGQSVEHEFNGSSLVIEGQIISGNMHGNEKIRSSMIAYEVKVLNCFKGHLENRVVTINTGSFCGYTFDVGGRYMIYANRLTKTGNYSVSGCSRTTGAVDYERSNIERFLSNAQEKESMRYFFGNESIFKHTFFAVEKSMREEFRKAMRD